jgi:hypothetical protein
VSVCRHFKEAEKIYVKNEDVMDRFHENSLWTSGHRIWIGHKLGG